jgi:hypothetical protein
MAVTTATIPQRLAETLIIDKTADSTAENNVFSGITLADKIYVLKLDNTAINGTTYLKGQIGTTYSTGSAPILRLYAPANSVVEYIFPEGWPAGGMSGNGAGFSFIGTSTDSGTGTQADPTGSGKFKVTILAGT